MMTEKESRLFYEGIRLFNERHYYESHEEWELIWLARKSEDRKFFQGLIILAGAFCHLQKKKFRPALVALTKSLQKLQDFAPNYLGVDLEPLIPLIEQNITFVASQQEQSLLWPVLIFEPIPLK